MTLPRLTIARLAPHETLFRVVPGLNAEGGEGLGGPGLTASTIAAAPAAHTAGAFDAFTPAPGTDGSPPAPGTAFVVLPSWQALAVAGRPVAVPVPDCSVVPALCAAANARTPAEIAKLTGPGLLFVDRGLPGAGAPPPASDSVGVLVEEAPGGRLALVAAGGGEVAAVVPVATVLFVVRPPKVDPGAGSEDAMV